MQGWTCVDFFAQGSCVCTPNRSRECSASTFIPRKWPEADEDGAANWMRTVDRLEGIGGAIGRELRPQRGRETRDDVEIVVESERVSLHMADRSLDEIRRQRILADTGWGACAS